jgi:cytochrome b subunit of formate dehydrogenase
MEKMTNKHEQKYLRMSLNERVQHFLLLSSFITLVITGFALKYPEAVWVMWVRKLFGDYAFEIRGIVHRIAAVVMTADSIYHIFYVSFTKRGRKLTADLWFYKKDLTDVTGTIKYYLGKSETKPMYGRFSYIEKSEYWALVWGNIVMGGTGVVLWFNNLFLPVISSIGMEVATAIHFYEAILASLAIVAWHFYFVIYNPDVYPINKAFITGYLTREEMEHEHPLELEEMERLESENAKKENIDEESSTDEISNTDTKSNSEKPEESETEEK